MEDKNNKNEDTNINIIKEENNQDNDINKDNIIVSKDNNKNIGNNSKYKIKYAHLLNFLKSRDKKNFYNENEYWCNILLFPPNIELSNKLSVINLLSAYYFKNRKNELLLNLANKIDKYSESFNAIDPAYGINVYYKTAEILNDRDTILYSYKYMLKLKDLIKKNLVTIKKKYNIDGLNEAFREIKDNFVNNFTNYKIKYSDDNYKIEDIHKLKKIIDLLLDNKYSLNLNNEEISTEKDNNNIYLFAINKKWVIKAKFFIENYIKIKEDKIENFYKESFDLLYIYNSYFDIKEKKDENNKKLFYAFPGPINNFEITSFKDIWIDFINLDENDFIKKKLKINEDYLLVKDQDWKFIKKIFGATNEIKRKKNNLDLVELKFILFDKRIDKKNDNLNLLKKKYLQINSNSTIKQLKEKIINQVNFNFIDLEEKDEVKANKQISFYILDKNKKNLLIEMCFSFIINNSSYDSIFIEKLDFKDDNSLKDFFGKYDKEKHILIIEIFNSKESNFFVDLKLKYNNKFKCTECDKIIENLKDKYNCEICNLSLFCSEQCAEKSNNHKDLHNQYFQILEEKFILSDLLSMNLEEILPQNTTYGRVGLYNLGNTCYLNSALQCLSNTEDLTKYFLKKCFQTEINNGSSLGSKGFISTEYYKLINRIWNGSKNKISPKEFRINFCKKTRLFLSSDQQDSQEFLLALLDNLHEDLNRITNKKYMELQEKQKGESDEQAAKRWWDYYKSRENSIIVDLFQGQFKSTIKCSSCKNSSISFDTYNNLGLPIPVQGTQIQFKLLTEELNFIDINMELDEKKEIKDIIKKAINCLNKKKYIEYLNKNNNSKIELVGENPNIYNNNENLEKILYNNIELIEFSKGFKINNIYKTNYENLKNNNKNQSLIDNVKISKLYHYSIDNSKELILYEKSINFEPNNYYNIYIYPMVEKEISGIFSSSIKKIILSYPIILTLSINDSLNQLESLLYQKLSKILKKEQNNSDLIEICFPHFTKSWGNLEIEKGECPICKKKYDKEKKKFCNLFKYIPKSTKISELINNINMRGKLILYAKSEKYNLIKELYSGIPLFNENSKRKSSKINLNIYDALDYFNKEEILEKDNMWFCNKCKQHRNAEKKIEIFRTPIYLIIQLKRFKNRNSFIQALVGNKNETFIEYKEILNLKDFVVGPDKDKSIYSLYGVIIHQKIMNGGHYYAYCKNKGLWITFNDESLSRCKNPVDKDAYLLFYKRKTLE